MNLLKQRGIIGVGHFFNLKLNYFYVYHQYIFRFPLLSNSSLMLSWKHLLPMATPVCLTNLCHQKPYVTPHTADTDLSALSSHYFIGVGIMYI